MRVPYLPIVIDYFQQQQQHVNENPDVNVSFFLSHFHTDHLRGLSSSWGVGHAVGRRNIYCSRITKALLLNEFGSGLASHVVALPVFQWVPIPITASYHVDVCLLPANHIPGSVQFLFRTFLGTILYTGDIKLSDELLQVMAATVAVYPIDHLYVDDTWLHLDKHERASGSAPGAHHAVSARSTLSQLLTDAQLEEAFESVARRVAPLSAAFEEAVDAMLMASLAQRDDDCIDAPLLPSELTENRPEPDSEYPASSLQGVVFPRLARPYVVRVYLHNHFGKEALLQRLARRLHTTIMVDDDRYRRLQCIAATFGDAGPEISNDRELLSQRVRSFLSDTCGASTVLDEATIATTSRAVVALWEAERIDLTLFVPHSRAIAWQRQVDLPHRSDTCSNNNNVFESLLEQRLGFVEVVNSRALISPAALHEASLRSTTVSEKPTPHFAIVMTGWAKLHRKELLAHDASGSHLWLIPYTLHSTPQQTEALVSILKPKSVTPLHYNRDKGFLVMARLGRLLRQPFTNDILSASVLRQAAVPLSLRHILFSGEDAPTRVSPALGGLRDSRWTTKRPDTVGFRVRPRDDDDVEDEIVARSGTSVTLSSTYETAVLCTYRSSCALSVMLDEVESQSSPQSFAWFC